MQISLDLPSPGEGSRENRCWLFGKGWAGTVSTLRGPRLLAPQLVAAGQGRQRGCGRVCPHCSPPWPWLPRGDMGVTATTPHRDLRPPPPTCSVCRGAGQLRPVCWLSPAGSRSFLQDSRGLGMLEPTRRPGTPPQPSEALSSPDSPTHSREPLLWVSPRHNHLPQGSSQRPGQVEGGRWSSGDGGGASWGAVRLLGDLCPVPSP